ncbi:MAG: sigma-70 family RNA polymerase sigma factor [Planctomycetes bacterium]|nr:sigma-70 family RNA polymerase sigma factor [Planctomycetota bacterium]
MPAHRFGVSHRVRDAAPIAFAADVAAPDCDRIPETPAPGAVVNDMPAPFDRDAELRFVAAVRAGDEDAMALFEDRVRCVPRMLAALNARRGRPFREHDLADLSQDTIVVALRKLPEFQPFAAFEAWLYRLCCYEFLNALRRRDRARRNEHQTADFEALERSAANSAEPNDDVHLALERLGGAEAATIRLKHFEGLTFPEIARRMGVSENTAKTRYYRGLSRLERLLDSNQDDQETP